LRRSGVNIEAKASLKEQTFVEFYAPPLKKSVKKINDYRLACYLLVKERKYV